MTMLSFTKL